MRQSRRVLSRVLILTFFLDKKDPLWIAISTCWIAIFPWYYLSFYAKTKSHLDLGSFFEAVFVAQNDELSKAILCAVGSLRSLINIHTETLANRRFETRKNREISNEIQNKFQISGNDVSIMINIIKNHFRPNRS